MINILFYGNCQLHAVNQTLNLPNDKFKKTLVECWTEKIDKDEFTNTIKNSDIIITQNINDNYRDVDYLSTSYIINNSKQNCRIIIFDSCYFDFYYFDLTYTYFNNDILRKPIDYHYKSMIECYKNNLSIEHYIDNYVNNVELKTEDELNSIAENSLNELKKRYEINKNKYNNENMGNMRDMYVISTYEFIRDNYKEKLLFYSMNHPTKYVIHHICQCIVNILQVDNTINYDIDLLAYPKPILYKSIQKCVHFDIHSFTPLTSDKTNIYEITELYYNTYKEIGFS